MLFWSSTFSTFASLASNPCTMSSHGSTMDYLYTVNNGVCVPTVSPSDSRTWQYKAWVKYGDQVRHMERRTSRGDHGVRN